MAVSVGLVATGTAESVTPPDIAIVGGRVVDPESGRDEIATVEIRGSRIGAVAEGPVTRAKRTIDATGLVVAPGFIDLHSHAQSLAGARMQALDGVTTALDLECGAIGVPAWLHQAGVEGRPINYGYSASWAAARALVLDDRRSDPQQDGTGFGAFQAISTSGSWTRPLDPRGLDRMTGVLREDIEGGALGVGLLLGYHPDTDEREVGALARLANDTGTPTFVHSRSAARTGPVTALDAVAELVEAARRTGAHVHLCHVNSTSASWVDEVIDVLQAARDEGLRVSTEAYPYGRGSTVVGASFLTPTELRREGRDPSSLIYLPTGETIADAARLEQLRASDPGGLVLTLGFDESDPTEAALLDRALLIPEAAFASDAMPITHPGAGSDQWPLPEGSYAHPRSAGCFSRVLRVLVRERGLLSLPEAVRRCTLVPAEILSQAAPMMRSKGRLQPGADADVVVFDPGKVADQATYATFAASVGVRHLLVGGCPVISDGVLQLAARPGRPITSTDPARPARDPNPALATPGGDT